MCGYFYIGFTNFILQVQSVLELSSLFSPNKHGKYDKIILKHFQ